LDRQGNYHERGSIYEEDFLKLVAALQVKEFSRLVVVYKKKYITSSVYDCTVEDVE